MNLPNDTKSDGDPDRIKHWLDYLAKLKDRQDRVDQLTGMTNWVLYGLIGTLVYKAVEILPIMFSDARFRYDTVILSVLCFNFFASGQRVFPHLLPITDQQSTEIRRIPEHLDSVLSSYIKLS